MFKISKELAQHIADSLEITRDDPYLEAYVLDQPYDLIEDLSDFVSTHISRAIYVLGREASVLGVKHQPVVQDGQIESELERMILDTIPANDQDFVLQTIANELIDYFKNGGTIEGSWGSARLEDRSIILDTVPTPLPRFRNA